MIIETASAERRRMARRLGFRSMSAFEEWEEEVVIDHFANFICDYLAPGYNIVPDKRGFIEFVDLDREVEQRVRALEERRFEVVLNPDKSECKFRCLPHHALGFCWERRVLCAFWKIAGWLTDDTAGIGRAKDHYKHFIVGVMADDMWLGMHGDETANVWKRNWTAAEATRKMFRYLNFLVKEWYDGAGDDSQRRKIRQGFSSVGR
jgi:hypothetical protein